MVILESHTLHGFPNNPLFYFDLHLNTIFVKRLPNKHFTKIVSGFAVPGWGLGTCKKIKSPFLREKAGFASLLSQKWGFY